MTFSDLSLDPVTREVTRGQRPISLTRTEFALLEMLIANPRRVLTRSRILERSGASTFRRRATHSRCTSATCAARPKPRENRD